MAKRRVSRVVEWGLGIAACTSLIVGATGVAEAASRPAAVPIVPVSIVNFRYKPKALTVVKGTKVIWTNKDSTGHNVIFKDFGSNIMGQGKTYAHRFTAAGTYKYHCSLHFEMTAKVVVTE